MFNLPGIHKLRVFYSICILLKQNEKKIVPLSLLGHDYFLPFDLQLGYSNETIFLFV